MTVILQVMAHKKDMLEIKAKRVSLDFCDILAAHIWIIKIPVLNVGRKKIVFILT